MYGYRMHRLALLAFAVACAGTAQAQTAGTLAVDLDASGSFSRDYAWTLDKQVSPTSVDRFIGETQQFAYRLVLTKGAPVDSDFSVEATVTISNPTASAATITGIDATFGGAAVSDDCAIATLAAGASQSCTFTFDAAGAATQDLVVNVATSGAVGGASGSASVAFAADGPVGNGSVTVTDSQLAQPVTFSASGVHEYQGSATCTDSNTVKIDNDATIVETGATDSAGARMACHALRMERTVAGQGGNEWTWDIAKSHALTGPLSLEAGASQDVTWTITATATAGDGGNTVTGAINGINTHPGMDAQLVSVGAAINGITAEVNCPSLVVPRAGYDSNRNIVLGRLSCPFTVTLPDGMVATSVSGRLTHQLFTYAPDGTATAGATRDIAGTQPVTGLAAGNTDECIELEDVYLGNTQALEGFCASEGNTTVTRTFTAPVTAAADSECEFTVPNLARLTTTDTGATDEATATVAVDVTDCEAEQPGGVLEVEIEGAGAFTREIPWTIEKTVTPASSDRFIGETQQLAYTLTVTRGEPQDAGYVVTGTASIVNSSAEAANLTAITITYGGLPVSHACATGELAAGATLSCPLEFTVPNDDPQTLVIDVDTDGDVLGAEASSAVAFGAPVVTGETVHVEDTLLPGDIEFTDSGVHRYTHDATCTDGNTVVVNNTATIVENGESDSATARVACHATRMERTVLSFGGTAWNWDLQKTHSQTLPLQVEAGQGYDVAYTITATATAGAGSDGEVQGHITVINTHPTMDAVVLSVAARINSTDAVVTCPTPMIAPHASYDSNSNIVVGRLVCPFTVTLAEGEIPATVTGRVEQQLFDYDSAGNATPDGIRLLQGTQPITNLPEGGVTDECVALVDVYQGTTHDLGEFCASEGNTTVSRTFTGRIEVTADSECEFSVPNLARLTTNDSDTVDEATTTVAVERTDCENTEPGGTLELDISGQGAFTREIPWTIEKAVTPESSDRFIGETQELAYTLTLTKGEPEDAGFVVTGLASIVNSSGAAAEVTSIAIEYGGMAVTHSCATGTLAAGATLSCPLEFTVANDEPQELTLAVETTGDVLGGNAATMVAFGAPTTTGDTVTVDDTLLADDITFSESGVYEYTHDATCTDGNTVVVDNTATIVETGDSDSARARVACHAIRMERSVTGVGNLAYQWDLVKSHGETGPLSMAAGDTRNVAYTITATATATSSGNGGVQGAITVVNTNPVTDAVILSVQAWINSTPATVTCPMPMMAPKATYDANSNIVVGKLVCPFTVNLPAGEVASTVTGRVEQQLYDYDSESHPTADGTKVLQGTQPVGTLSGGTVTDECVAVTDVYLGQSHDLGQFCVSQGQLSRTFAFTGAIAVTADSECEFSVPNVARLVAADTGATDESTTSIAVERSDCEAEEPAGMCTRTQGYWSTHSINGPAPYDPTWALIGETTPFFSATWNGGTLGWYQVMWMQPRGNAYYILAPQFVAATLNTLAGVTAPQAVLDAMDEAQALLEAWTPAQVAEMKGSHPVRARFIETAGVLDAFNNGAMGPAHCKADHHARLVK